jgi:flagellar basal-body rod protein FlgB
MAISFQQALGMHPKAVQLRLERTGLLAANLANVDTPNFKAKDMDFTSEMQRADFGRSDVATIQMKYRMPLQPSQDGNTVALDIEQAAFSQNSMDFQTSLTFLNMKFRGLQSAIEGK